MRKVWRRNGDGVKGMQGAELRWASSDGVVTQRGTCQRLWCSQGWNLGLVESRSLIGIRSSKVATGRLCGPGS